LRTHCKHSSNSLYHGLWLLYLRNTQLHNERPAQVPPSEDMSSIVGITERTPSQVAHEHTASPATGSTAQQPTSNDLAASESNVPSANPPTIAYPIMAAKHSSATTPPNHGATQDTGIPPAPPPHNTSSDSSGPVKKSRKMQVGKAQNGRYVVGCT
jgi:hypothetical protein